MKPYTILWENQSLIAVCKAANVSSVADEKDSADLCTQLCAYTGNTVYPVHRLDRMTGGVIVYAKTTAAAAALSAQMKAHTTQKTCLAVVEGVPALSCATLRHFLFFRPSQGKKLPCSNTTDRFAYAPQRQGSNFGLYALRKHCNAAGNTFSVARAFEDRTNPSNSLSACCSRLPVMR